MTDNLSEIEKIPKIAILIITFDKKVLGWGDTDFGQKLQKAFQKLGFYTDLFFLDEWHKVSDHDLVINLRGPQRYHTDRGRVNILWIMSYTNIDVAAEMADYDIVCCASQTLARELTTKTGIPVYYLPQATSEDYFDTHIECDKIFDLLFVGNNNLATMNKVRKIVPNILQLNLKYDFKVIGFGWDRFIDKKYIFGNYFEYSQQPEVYSRAKINLNDHNPGMIKYGFINNRTYDIAALGQFQISDEVPTIDQLGIVTYSSLSDLKAKIEYYMINETEREQIARINKDAVRENTFEKHAKKLLGWVLDCIQKAKVSQ